VAFLTEVKMNEYLKTLGILILTIMAFAAVIAGTFSLREDHKGQFLTGE